MSQPAATVAAKQRPVDLSPAVPGPVQIVDDTLREGVETPGFHFGLEAKLKLAAQLDELGVDYIEAGIPGAGPEEFAATRALARAGLTATISAIGRVYQPEYNDACLRAGVGAIHLAVMTSPAGIEHVLKVSRTRLIDSAATVVQGLKREGVQVFFSATDGSRAELDLLGDLFAAVSAAGADVFVLADTVGALSPAATATTVRYLRDRSTGTIGIHCHNDLGLAVANSLAAVQVGAGCVDVSLCGVGARVGNTNLGEFVTALRLLHGGQTRVRLDRLVATAELLAELSGQPVHPGWPLVGERAFAAVEGVGLRTYPGPVADLLANSLLRPELVGARAVHYPRPSPPAAPAP